MNMLGLFSAGDTIGGYCAGYFGRDDYDNKVCIMVLPKYAVFQNEEGGGSILNYQEDLSRTEVSKWKAEYDKDEY